MLWLPDRSELFPAALQMDRETRSHLSAPSKDTSSRREGLLSPACICVPCRADRQGPASPASSLRALTSLTAPLISAVPRMWRSLPLTYDAVGGDIPGRPLFTMLFLSCRNERELRAPRMIEVSLPPLVMWEWTFVRMSVSGTATGPLRKVWGRFLKGTWLTLSQGAPSLRSGSDLQIPWMVGTLQFSYLSKEFCFQT